MDLEELRQNYYSEFSLEELRDIELSIMDKLRDSSILKGLKQ